MKRSSLSASAAQLGFDGFLEEAETINRAAVFEKECSHLPGTMEEALPFYRGLIERHHAAMLAADLDTVMRLRKEAHDLARKLNKGDPGILAGPDAPGCILETLTAAEPEIIPLWGQRGSFIAEVKSVRVRVEMDGIFGIGACFMPWPNFGAHAVDWDKPFLSETGYRSFMGLHAPLEPRLTPDTFAAQVVNGYVNTSLKGKLVPIQARCHKP